MHSLQFRRSVLRNSGFIWLEERLPDLFDWMALYLTTDTFCWDEIKMLDHDDIVEVLATVKAHVEFAQWAKTNRYLNDRFLSSDAIAMPDKCKQILEANMQYWQPLQVMR